MLMNNTSETKAAIKLNYNQEMLKVVEVIDDSYQVFQCESNLESILCFAMPLIICCFVYYS